MYVIDLLIISLSINFDKTKCILFSWDKNLPDLNITYNSNRIKQYRMVECLVCCLVANLSGESIAMKFLRKINEKLRFCYATLSFNHIFTVLVFFGTL